MMMWKRTLLFLAYASVFTGASNTNISLGCPLLCQNGGVCQLNKHQIAVCDCVNDWMGPYCEISRRLLQTNDVEPGEEKESCPDNHVCYNRGECKRRENEPDRYTCECQGEWKGPTCQTKGAGTNNPHDPFLESFTTTKHAENKDPKNEGLIIGVSVGACSALFVIVGLAIWGLRRRDSSVSTKDETPIEPPTIGDTEVV